LRIVRQSGILLSMKHKIFVDGQEGTTGLEIYQRLEKRPDLELLRIDPDKRKDPAERKRLANEADIVFLCLPDDAARETVSLVDNDTTCVIDASTAHRTNPDWVYGIPELAKNQRERIQNSRRISVPGCHATGFVVAVTPLIAGGMIPADYPFSFQSLTGYSGGGKKLIAYYEQEIAGRDTVNAPRLYATGLTHKHLPEVTMRAGLAAPPVFTPVLANIYKGMLVTVPLQLAGIRKTAQELHAFLEDHYRGETFVRVMPFAGENSLEDNYLHPMGCNETNRLDLFVFGNDTQAVLASRLDNLGKGASGAAVQCMNIRLGVDEKTGLTW
jgi:N-acetyl-gamma-glutamyl-phosphate reductase